MAKKNPPTAESIFKEYDKGKSFNSQFNLNEIVETNENFFVGKQWEGVTSNGLPTPVFNFLKRVVLFQVASILSDNIKMQASPTLTDADQQHTKYISEIVSNEFDTLFETNKIGSLLREFMRNAAVDGDGCTFTYWDPDVETGQKVKGAIVTEIIENTRVYFGNPNERRVQRQPYIIIESREMLESVKDRAEANGVTDTDAIQPDSSGINAPSRMADDRVTVLLRLWKNKETGTIWACESVKDLIIREPWDLKIKLYPVTWMNWDYIQDCYHGQAMITGLIPNQVFVNKAFAMVMLSLMQSAFPKVVYDKTRISKWTNQVGTAIGVNGGDMNNVARIIEPAQISPQVSQFLSSVIDYTQTFLGVTSAAAGDTRADNAAAIVALQKGSAVPSELTKQNLYQSIEDLGRIYLEFMTAYYGKRIVKISALSKDGVPNPTSESANNPALINPQQAMQNVRVAEEFDFGSLGKMHIGLKLDVGASSYWSEIAAVQTLDNLLMQGKIDLVDYLERIPQEYISNKQELIDKYKGQQAQQGNTALSMPGMSPDNPAQAVNAPIQNLQNIASKGQYRQKRPTTGVINNFQPRPQGRKDTA